eukprot:1896108-Amphidinium_carterae.1
MHNSPWADVAEHSDIASDADLAGAQEPLISWSGLSQGDAAIEHIGGAFASGWGSVSEEPLSSCTIDVKHVVEEDLLLPESLQLSNYVEPKKRRGRPFSSLASRSLGSKDCPDASIHHSASSILEPTSIVEDAKVAHGQAASITLHSLLVPTVQSYIRPTIHDHKPLSICSSALQAAMHVCEKKAVPLDECYSKIQETFIDNGQKFHACSLLACSLLVRAQMLNVGPDELKRKLVITAAGQWIYSKLQRALVEQAIVLGMSQCHLVCYIDCMSYDETPLHIRVTDPMPSFKDVLVSGVAAELALKDAVGELPLSLTTESPSMKILQVRQMFAVVFKLPAGFCQVMGESLTPLAAMEKNSAQNLLETLMRRSAASVQSHEFKLKSRICCMDSAGSNILTERALAASKSEKWVQLQHLCEVHTIARCFRATFDTLMPQHISAIIHIALALRHGSSMLLFRRALLAEIQSRLKVYFGPAPDEARAYREKMMCLFMTSGSKLLLHRVLLSKLPNGLWSEMEVQVYLPLEMRGKVSCAQVSKTLQAAILFVMTGTKPHVFPRHRWTGADLSVEELLRLEGVHYLLSTTWKRFMAMHSKVSATVLCSGGATADQAVTELGLDGEELVTSHDPALSASDGNVIESVESADNMVNEKQRGPALHSLDRQKGSDWLQSSLHSPLSVLVLLRTCMQPLVVLLNAQLDLASLDWELKQQASIAL